MRPCLALSPPDCFNLLSWPGADAKWFQRDLFTPALVCKIYQKKYEDYLRLALLQRLTFQLKGDDKVKKPAVHVGNFNHFLTIVFGSSVTPAQERELVTIEDRGTYFNVVADYRWCFSQGSRRGVSRKILEVCPNYEEILDSALLEMSYMAAGETSTY